MENSPAVQYGLPAVLAFIMIGMGMSLRPVDFRRVVVYPKAALVGLFGQLIFLPAVGFLIVYLYPLRPEMAVGIMVLAACPGGTTSNLITHMARGNVALSVTLTAISGTVTVFSIPYLVNLALAVFMPAADPEQQVQLPVLETIGTLVLIVLVPTIIGMCSGSPRKTKDSIATAGGIR